MIRREVSKTTVKVAAGTVTGLKTLLTSTATQLVRFVPPFLPRPECSLF